jgi:hypothetical protein
MMPNLVMRNGTASDRQLTLPLAERPKDELVAGEQGPGASTEEPTLMAQILERENLKRALRQVRQNRGAPGIDGMTVDELPAYLRQHWPEIRAQLEAGKSWARHATFVAAPVNFAIRGISMPLENFYPGDDAFSNFSVVFQEEWDSFEKKEELLILLNNNIELARPIAFRLGSNFSSWLSSTVPALEHETPLQCLKSSEGIKRLKTCLMRMP